MESKIWTLISSDLLAMSRLIYLGTCLVILINLGCGKIIFNDNRPAEIQLFEEKIEELEKLLVEIESKNLTASLQKTSELQGKGLGGIGFLGSNSCQLVYHCGINPTLCGILGFLPKFNAVKIDCNFSNDN